MKVHFLTPSYDGSCHISTAWSIIIEIRLLDSLGIKSDWDFYPGCCYPDIARNMLIDTFYSGNATHAFFIDSDVQWEPGAAVRLLKRDVDFVAGAYSYKSDKEGYPVIYNQQDIDGMGYPIVNDQGLIDARGVPTGFLCLKRRVFDMMIEKFGDDLWIEDHKDPKNPIKYRGFFNTPQIGRQKFGEDLYFCKTWVEMGQKIWIDPNITFWHHGLKGFKGNFHKYLSKLPNPKEFKIGTKM